MRFKSFQSNFCVSGQLIGKAAHLRSDSKGAALVEASLTVLVFLVVIFSCCGFATYAYKLASLNYILFQSSRKVLIGTPGNARNNALTRDLLSVVDIETDIISRGKKYGLFHSEANIANSPSIRVCDLSDPVNTCQIDFPHCRVSGNSQTNIPPDTKCQDTKPTAGALFALSAYDEYQFLWGAVTLPIRSTVISRVE